MPTPNLPPGFDFTDPDIYAERLPIDELAEMRKVAPIWWNEQPVGTGGFDDGGFWVVTKHKDVKEVSLRSDVFSSLEKTALPRYKDGTAQEQIDTGKFVLLNMDAPHHTHLRKIISRGFTPRAVERLRDDLDQRAQNIVKAAAAEGSGDFVEQVSCELPLQAIAGLLGVPQEDRKKLFHWSNEMVGADDPEFARIRRAERLGRADHLRHAVGRTRGPRNPGEDIVTKLIEADVEGHKLSDDEFGFFVILLAVAGNETTRNSITQGMMAFTDFPDQWELYKRERPATAADEIVRWATPITSFQRTALEDTELIWRADQEGPAGGDVLPLGQLRRGRLRRPVHVQHPARSQPARRIRRHRRPLLHRREPGPDDDRPDIQRHRRPHAGPHADLEARAATVGLAQRHQALAGGLHGRLSRQISCRALGLIVQDRPPVVLGYFLACPHHHRQTGGHGDPEQAQPQPGQGDDDPQHRGDRGPRRQHGKRRREEEAQLRCTTTSRPGPNAERSAASAGIGGSRLHVSSSSARSTPSTVPLRR